MKNTFRLLLIAVMASCIGSVAARGETGPGVPGASAVPAARPSITNFQLNGERWTCEADGRPLSGIMLKPVGPGPFPAIILSHGLGGNAQGIVLSRGTQFAGLGFVCIATDYTHARPGNGARAAGNDRFAGIDFSQAGARPENVRRALACLEILRRQQYVDAHRIVAYGHSMGAFVTIALAAAAPDKLAAAAITSGGVMTPDYRQASAPTTNVAAQVRAPFLILQGGKDSTVPPGSSALLKEVLDRNQVPNERHVFEGVGHNVPMERSTDFDRLVQAWFSRWGILGQKGCSGTSKE